MTSFPQTEVMSELLYCPGLRPFYPLSRVAGAKGQAVTYVISFQLRIQSVFQKLQLILVNAILLFVCSGVQNNKRSIIINTRK